MKKKLVLVLVLAIVISAFSINAHAAFTGYLYSETGNEITKASMWYREIAHYSWGYLDYPVNDCRRPLYSKGTTQSFATMVNTVGIGYDVDYGIQTISDYETGVFRLNPYCWNACTYGSYDYYTYGVEKYVENGVVQDTYSVWGSWTFAPYALAVYLRGLGD